MSLRPLPGPEIYIHVIASASEPVPDVQGWNSNHPIFKKLIEEIKPGVIVECGTWKGASAIHMAKLAPDAKIYCCDTWLGGIDHDAQQEKPFSCIPRDLQGYPRLYHEFTYNVVKHGVSGRIVPVVQTSVNAGRLLKLHGIKADLCYIDASHEYPDTLFDMDIYWQLLRPGGIMFGDDMTFPGVAQSVAEFAKWTGETVEVACQNFWMFRKP